MINGDLHWLERKESTDTVLTAGQGWSIIQDCQIQKPQMNTGY